MNIPKRGEVYFIRIPAGSTTIHEIKFSRPGVIVSTDELNGDLHTVNVVFLSTAAAERHDIPANRHPQVFAGKPSAAICEQVTTVDESRLGSFICRLTDEEMESIDSALLHCLGLPRPGMTTESSEDAQSDKLEQDFPQEEPADQAAALGALLRRELEVYKQLYNDLLSRVIKIA